VCRSTAIQRADEETIRMVVLNPTMRLAGAK